MCFRGSDFGEFACGAQVHNVLESHLQRVGQQSQAWLALGGHQELEEQENVEEGDAHQKVTSWLQTGEFADVSPLAEIEAFG